MVDQKSAKSEDGKGVPPAGEQKTAETRTYDRRLFPGGSPDGSTRPVGVSAIDRDAMWIDDVDVQGIKSTF
jgi:hypothetical protein